MLNTSTPFAKAIFELFTQLEELIQTQTNEPGACRAYLFGGCAVHIHTNARGSSDVDVELEAMKKGLKLDELVLKLDPVFYDDPEAGQEVLYYDETFNPTLAPLHEDYQQDAIPLEIRNNSPLWVYVVTKADLAVSKLGRFGGQDILDIHTLFDHGLEVESFRKRAEAAIRYAVGNETELTGRMNHVISSYKPITG